MANKEKLKIGGIAFLILLVGSLSGVGINEALNSDEPLYICNTIQEITNCPFGLSGGQHTICYTQEDQNWYDDDVKNCESGWKKIDKDKVLEELYEKEPKQGKVWGKQFKCNQTGCIEINI